MSRKLPPTLKEVTEMNYTPMPIKQHWRDFIGNIPADEQFTMHVVGESGGGKSTLCLELADEFSTQGTVLYNAAEENVKSGTIKLRADLLRIKRDNIYIYSNTIYSELREELKTGLYKFCFVDSINTFDVPDIELLPLKTDFPEVNFVFVAQMDGQERFARGSSKWKHGVDVRIFCENEDDVRTAYNQKPRYGCKNSSRFIFSTKKPEALKKALKKDPTWQDYEAKRIENVLKRIK